MKGGIMGTKGFFQRFTIILIGLVLALSFLFLTGATSGTQIGRYEMATTVRRGFTEVYIIDTATGVVKYVDPKDENRPFEEIKSR